VVGHLLLILGVVAVVALMVAVAVSLVLVTAGEKVVERVGAATRADRLEAATKTHQSLSITEGETP
jgi:hypothetical protein